MVVLKGGLMTGLLFIIVLICSHSVESCRLVPGRLGLFGLSVRF